MDNPARTAQFRALIAERQRLLTARFASLFPEPASFVWEIGCGHGHFLTAYAAAHPEKLCVGIDIDTERIVKANRKRDRAGLSNLHFIQAEARVFLDSLPSHARPDEIFVLFPDPWPKLRHRKHRLLQAPFVQALAGKATGGARLYFRTDYEPYFAEVAGMLDSDVGWKRVEEPWPFEFETVFQCRAPGYRSLIARRTAPPH